MTDNAVGRVSVKVVPLLDGFREKVKRELASLKDFKIKVGIKLDDKHLGEDFDRYREKFKKPITVPVKASIKDSLAKIRAELTKAIKSAEAGQKIKIPVEVKGNLKELASILTTKIQGGGGGPGAALLGIGKGMAAISAAYGAVQVIAGLTAAAAQLSGLAFTLPAGIAALGISFLALKFGAAGVKDALAGDVEAMKELEPSARSAVKALHEFVPAWAKIQNAVQENLFKDLAGPLKDLASKVLPILKTGLTGTAKGLNGMVAGLIAAVKTEPALNDIQEIFSGTNDMLGNMRGTLGKVASGLLGIGGVGAQYLGRLGTAVDKVAGKFKDWVDHSVESGKINDYIDAGIKALKQMGTIAGNVGGSIKAIFKGLGSGGAQSFLTTIVEITGKVRKFLDSVQGQEALSNLGQIFKAVGTAAREVFFKALALIPPILKVITPIITFVANKIAEYPGFFLAAGVAVGGFVKAVSVITRIAGFAKIAKDAFKSVGLAVEILKLTKLTDWVTGITDSFKKVGDEADKTGDKLGEKGKFKKALVGLAKTAGIGIALGLVAVGMNAVNESSKGADNLVGWDENLQDIAGAVQQVATLDFEGIFGRIREQLGQTNQVWRDGKAPIQEWFSTVKTSFQNDFIGVLSALPGQVSGTLSGVVAAGRAKFEEFKASANRSFNEVVTAVRNKATAITESVSSGLSSLPGRARAKFEEFKNAARQKFDEAVTYARGIPGRISSALTGFNLFGAGQALVSGFVSGLRAKFDSAIATAREKLSVLRGLFPYSPAKWGPFSGRGYTSYSGRALMEDFAAGIKRGATYAITEANIAQGRIASALNGIDDPITRRLSMDSSLTTAVQHEDFGNRPIEVTAVTNLDGRVLTKTVNMVNTKDAKRR